MNRLILCAALAVPFAGLPALNGCDREVATETDVRTTDDGTVVTEETTVSETPDGGVKTEETKTVDKPDQPDTVKTEETVRNEDGTVKKEETKKVD